MATKISKNNLQLRIQSHDGIHKTYSANLKDFNVPIDVKIELETHGRGLRSILRSKENFREAIGMLDELEMKMKNDQFPNGDYTYRALYYSAVTLYGACFVKGGSDNALPMQYFINYVRDIEVHKEIMIYRHKLIGHLDEDHEVRRDELGWDLIVQLEGGLNPSGPHLNGDKVLLNWGGKNIIWKDHMALLISKIDDRTIEISLIVNELLGKVEAI